MQGVVKQVSISSGGLPKHGVSGQVVIGSGGVNGDRQKNLKYHGGPDKAVLMIAAEIVSELAERGYPVGCGSLGENITVAGMAPALWRKGQRYQVGEDLVIELTTLRQPCANLDVYGHGIQRELYDTACRAGDVTSPRWARGGFYARVIHGGTVVTGDAVRLVSK